MFGRLLRRRIVPFVVWSGAIAAILWLLPRTGRTGVIHGLVEAQRSAVVVPVAGTLVSVQVERHQRIEAGQVVGRLSDAELLLALAGARCELERLRSDLRRREAELAHDRSLADARHQMDAMTELRRRTSEVEAARLDELETQAELAEARVRLSGLEVEVEREAALERRGIATDTQLVRLRTEQDALRQRIAELDGVLLERKTRVASARARRDEFTAASGGDLPVDRLLEPMQWRLKAQDNELERIALEGRKLDLKAPVGGTVEAVHFHAGQWVPEGSTLLTIVEPTARRILAYVPEPARPKVSTAAAIHVVRDGSPIRREARVLSMSPAVVRVPERLWLDPRTEEWAWEVVLAAGPDDAPGERVTLVPAR